MAVIEIKYNNAKAISALRVISVGIIVFLACFRFDIQDYWGYFQNYYSYDNHSEYGFLVLSQLFRFFNIDFRFFVIAVGLVSVLGLYRGIRKYSPYAILSLAISFHTIVLTYFLSGIRQGLVYGLFIGFMIEFIVEKKWIKYYVLCPLLGLIHASSWILLILPFLILIPLKFYKYLVGMSVVAGAINFLFGTQIIGILNRIGSFWWYGFDENISPSWLGIAERVFMCAFIVYLYHTVQEETSEKEELLYKAYLTGFMISAVFAPWAMLCSRVPATIKAIEVLLIPILIYKHSGKKVLLVAGIFTYVVLMSVKNLELYDSNTNAFTYPWYFSFTKDADRKMDERLKIMNINDIDTVKEIFTREVQPVYKQP